MAKTLKVIFLDIDGVLLPFPKEENSGDGLFPPSPLKALQSLLMGTNGAKLVLSSTWRVRKDFIQDIVDSIQGFGIDFEGFFDIFWRQLPLLDILPKMGILLAIGLGMTLVSTVLFKKNIVALD